MLLVSTLNGQLSAVEKKTGVVLWSRYEDPVLKVGSANWIRQILIFTFGMSQPPIGSRRRERYQAEKRFHSELVGTVFVSSGCSRTRAEPDLENPNF